ncbi:hypothetical protein F5X96DRAFT_376830 [Biscogniauxia mediterranea]|nr:hypothetical protein F5X96DRAFT_376830 [Biscogniauxia mediterranea]
MLILLVHVLQGDKSCQCRLISSVVRSKAPSRRPSRTRHGILAMMGIIAVYASGLGIQKQECSVFREDQSVSLSSDACLQRLNQPDKRPICGPFVPRNLFFYAISAIEPLGPMSAEDTMLSRSPLIGAGITQVRSRGRRTAFRINLSRDISGLSSFKLGLTRLSAHHHLVLPALCAQN